MPSHDSHFGRHHGGVYATRAAESELAKVDLVGASGYAGTWGCRASRLSPNAARPPAAGGSDGLNIDVVVMTVSVLSVSGPPKALRGWAGPATENQDVRFIPPRTAARFRLVVGPVSWRCR